MCLKRFSGMMMTMTTRKIDGHGSERGELVGKEAKSKGHISVRLYESELAD